MKNIYRRDQKFWARRPLTRDMICYAAADVLALVPTIYNAMARYSTVQYCIVKYCIVQFSRENSTL